jgi:Trypsin-like peptidase domain
VPRLQPFALLLALLALPRFSAAQPAASAPACEGGWTSRVYRLAHGSVARIEVPGSFGAGFLVFDRQHVATALHVVALGRPAKVQFATGAVLDAHVVAVSSEHDLAILELEAPVDATPLELADSDRVDLGTPVAAIGHPQYSPLLPASMRGLLEWSVSQGVVSAKNDAFIQTDAPLNPGNSGGPLLGCDGRVLAVVSSQLRDSQGIAFGIPSHRLATLRQEIGHQIPYYGRFTFGDWGLGFAMLLTGPDNFYGAYVGGSFIALDRVSLTARIGFAFGGTSNPDASTTTSSHTAQLIELAAGYRFLFLAGPVPIYVVPELGLSNTLLRRNDTHFVLNGGQVQLIEDASRLHPIRASAGVTLHAVGLQLAYSLRPDFGNMGDATHLVLLGFEL